MKGLTAGASKALVFKDCELNRLFPKFRNFKYLFVLIQVKPEKEKTEQEAMSGHMCTYWSGNSERKRTDTKSQSVELIFHSAPSVFISCGL